MTKSTTDIPILDDDQLARIERESYAASRADVRALYQTVRVLRAENERLKGDLELARQSLLKMTDAVENQLK